MTGAARWVPGLAWIVGGRPWAGAGLLLTWTAAAAVLLLRWERVVEVASAPGPGGAVALATLGAGLLAPWVVALRENARPAGPRIGPPGRHAAAFARNRVAVLGLFLLGGIVAAALLAPLLAPADPSLQGSLVTGRLAPPSSAHPLGTDRVARDVLSRLLFGARVSLSIAFLAVAISVTLGTLVGAVAGYLGGRLDAFLMRLVDVVLAFPRLVLLIAVVAFFEPSVGLVVLVLGLTQWPSVARLVRGEVLGVREREYVLAARALGFGTPRILGRHVLPNVMGPVVVAATLGVGNTVVLEAGLSFLGLGPPSPVPTWGGMIADGQDVLLDAWWLGLFPGLAVVLTVLALNLVGDGLRDAFDPHLGEAR